MSHPSTHAPLPRFRHFLLSWSFWLIALTGLQAPTWGADPSVPDGQPALGYAIVASRLTAEDPAWTTVIEALQKKYGATRHFFGARLEEVQGTVRAARPRYVAFVARPEEVTQAFVYAANDFCRTLDADPYVDAVWGILVASTAKEAVRLATAPPLAMTACFTKTGGVEWLRPFRGGGIYLTEMEHLPGRMAVKEHGAISETLRRKYNDTKKVVDTLNDNRYQFVVTSGHATPTWWELMYPKGGGCVAVEQGRLVGDDRQGHRYPVTSDNPKAVLAIGNCLSSLVSDDHWKVTPDRSLALAWIRHGANQYIGAVDTTWHGAMWHYLKPYLLDLGGRYTLAEALFLARQRIHFQSAVGEFERSDDGVDRLRNGEGSRYTERIFVLYGDPAYEARIDQDPAFSPAYTETWTVTPVGGSTTRKNVTYTVTALSRSWKNGAALFPFSGGRVTQVQSTIRKAVVTDDTVCWLLERPLEAGQSFSISFLLDRDPDAPAENTP